jgi:kynureninase
MRRNAVASCPSFANNGRETFNLLTENGVIGDWREPNVIRLSPVPLYNSFKQVFAAGSIIAASVK